MVERFTREDFAHVASLLRTLSDDDLQFRAVSSNNYNVILSALDFAAATRPAEAQAVAEGWKLVPDGDPVELDDCPEGLFDFDGHLGLMTEYATVSEKDGRRQRDAYVVASGEYFWGDAKTAQERAKLIVQPLAASPATGGA